VGGEQFAPPDATTENGKLEVLPLLIPPVLNEIYVPGDPFLHCETTEPRRLLKRAGKKAKPPTWALPVSVWGRRPQEVDSKSFWDTEGIRLKAFKIDWKRCKYGCDGSKLIKDPEEKDKVMGLLQEHYGTLSNLMVDYGSFTPHDPFDISWNGFRELCRDTNITLRKLCVLS
jgi:hypothetical protein